MIGTENYRIKQEWRFQINTLKLQHLTANFLHMTIFISCSDKQMYKTLICQYSGVPFIDILEAYCRNVCMQANKLWTRKMIHLSSLLLHIRDAKQGKNRIDFGNYISLKNRCNLITKSHNHFTQLLQKNGEFYKLLKWDDWEEVISPMHKCLVPK